MNKWKPPFGGGWGSGCGSVTSYWIWHGAWVYGAKGYEHLGCPPLKTSDSGINVMWQPFEARLSPTRMDEGWESAAVTRSPSPSPLAHSTNPDHPHLPPHTYDPTPPPTHHPLPFFASCCVNAWRWLPLLFAAHACDDITHLTARLISCASGSPHLLSGPVHYDIWGGRVPDDLNARVSCAQHGW